jgi:hypothetical protein
MTPPTRAQAPPHHPDERVRPLSLAARRSSSRLPTKTAVHCSPSGTPRPWNAPTLVLSDVSPRCPLDPASTHEASRCACLEHAACCRWPRSGWCWRSWPGARAPGRHRAVTTTAAHAWIQSEAGAKARSEEGSGVHDPRTGRPQTRMNSYDTVTRPIVRLPSMPRPTVKQPRLPTQRRPTRARTLRVTSKRHRPSMPAAPLARGSASFACTGAVGSPAVSSTASARCSWTWWGAPATCPRHSSCSSSRVLRTTGGRQAPFNPAQSSRCGCIGSGNRGHAHGRGRSCRAAW